MSARDDLLRFAKDLADPDWSLSVPKPAKDVIGKLVAIIEVQPRTIATAEELDALPFEAVLRDAEGHVLERWGQPEENLWATVMVNAYIPSGAIALPATVLFDPEAQL